MSNVLEGVGRTLLEHVVAEDGGDLLDGFGFRVWGLGFRVSGFGFWV